MRYDMIMLACGAVALGLYFAGLVVPAAIAVAVGSGALVWAVLMKR
jgi:hypothetical protein